MPANPLAAGGNTPAPPRLGLDGPALKVLRDLLPPITAAAGVNSGNSE